VLTELLRGRISQPGKASATFLATGALSAYPTDIERDDIEAGLLLEEGTSKPWTRSLLVVGLTSGAAAGGGDCCFVTCPRSFLGPNELGAAFAALTARRSRRETFTEMLELELEVLADIFGG